MSSPSAKPRWSARVGNVMRRTSTVLTISRPGSVASNKDADNASLSGSTKDSTKGRDASTLNPPPPPPVVSNPSPMAEPPLREAAAVGPSPLAQPIPSYVVPPTLPPSVEEPQSPTGYIPPPVIDSTVGNPGAFTDLPDELPQPDIAQDPHAVAPVEEILPPPAIDPSLSNPGASADVAEELPQPDFAQLPAVVPIEEKQNPLEYIPPPVVNSTADDHGASPDMADLPQPEITQDSQAVAPVEPHVEPATELDPIITEALVDEPASYFDEPMTESIKDFEPADHVDNKTEFSEAVRENATTISPQSHQEAAEHHDVIPTTVEAVHENDNVVLPEPEAHDHDDFIPVTTEREETQQQPESIPILVPVAVHYNIPSYSNLGVGQEVWGGEHDHDREVLHDPYEGSEQIEKSPAPSIKMPEADPFADPVAPRISVSHSELDMPQPEFTEGHHAESHQNIQGPVAMPLPSFYEVAASKSIHHAPSTSSFRIGGARTFVETDETLPLLSRPVTPTKHKPKSYLQPNAHPQSHNFAAVSPLVYSGSQSTTSNNGHAQTWHPHPGANPRLRTLGWLEYHLPDGTVYYVHPTSMVTTEINLRSERLLTGVEGFLADHDKNQSSGGTERILPAGGEIWLRDVGTAKSGMILERWWVDHRSRTVVMSEDEHDHDRKGSGKGKAPKGGAVLSEEDQLDTEYRYWSFMEAHPAHNSLPVKAKTEAMDVLTWAWTERLLPSHRAIPAPFTQEECQELMTLIRSFGDDHDDDHGIQTRIVSRVLLRVAHWRQTYFRPNKPLPTNVGSNLSRLPITPRRPFRRVIIDFVVSCLFLGIPYIFFERTRFSSRIDEESGLRNATPTLVIGACTCLVAAIVLSASVTFLSLPGLDAVSRTTSMVAILLAAFSMAATVVAIFKHKADLERPISHMGIEGMMVISRRTVILSLPLVLLVYSIIAIVTSIVLYSFRGLALSDPLTTKKSFESYTRWGAVTVVGVLAGMVTTSALLFRR